MDKKTLDERYHISEAAIMDAFLLVLREKHLDKITVTDVIKRAGIVRSTFYNHFEDIPALVTAMEDKTINEIFCMMETFHPQNDREVCRSFYLTVCSYAMTNPLLAGLLKSPRGDSFFEKTLVMFHHYVKDIIQKRNSPGQDEEVVSYMIACSIGCTIGVLHKWARDEFAASKETVADVLTEAFMSGMLPYIS